MKTQATAKSGTGRNTAGQSHAPQFIKALDGRKQPIRGLWERNGRYYARLAVENPITGVKKTRRIPLKDKDGVPVSTVAQALEELNRHKIQRADNNVPVLGRQPKFRDYAKHYLEVAPLGKEGEEPKKPGTIEKEESILKRWIAFLGDLRLDQIKRVHVNRFIESRRKEETEDGTPKVSARTINLDVITFRVVMKQAMADGVIQRLPTEGLEPLKTNTRTRPLFTTADLEKVCNAAFGKRKNRKGRKVRVTQNAQEFVDYIKLMAYSGVRRNEALGLKWEDLDSSNGHLHVRRQVTHRGIEALKNRQERTVDLNPRLKAHLQDMKARSRDVSDWLFPSPQRGNKDIPAKSFRESLDLVRTQAGMPNFNFHDCRHHFISMSVMSGIDFMTIATWVGHQDGGVLIGKVYGHLANEHRKAMAEKVNFGPVVLQQTASA